MVKARPLPSAMARSLATSLALSLALTACMAQPARPGDRARTDDACTPATEFEPALCPLQLPRIVSIAVTRNAVKSPLEKDASVDCSGFVLTPEQVRRYLGSARVADAADAHHTLDWSPCSAAGRLTLTDGRTAEWSIDQYRAGTLSIGGAPTLTLYCPTCRFKPFQW